jgi:gustatory receptor
LQKVSPLSDPGKMVKYLLFATYILVEIYIPCYYGNEIILESAKLLDSSYNCDWRAMSPQFRMCLRIFRENLKRPITIVIASMYELNLEITDLRMRDSVIQPFLVLNLYFFGGILFIGT